MDDSEVTEQGPGYYRGWDWFTFVTPPGMEHSLEAMHAFDVYRNTRAAAYRKAERNNPVTERGTGYERGKDWFRFTPQLDESSLVALEAADAYQKYLDEGNPPLPVSTLRRSTDTKDTNPKDLIGSDKLPLHLWPTTATAMGCLALLDGMGKYGRQNWREFGVSASIYVAACKRHLDAWFEGEEHATDSGVPHLSHALACLAIIVDSQAQGKLIDDRAYMGAGYLKLVDALTPIVKNLRARHAGKDVHHFTIKDNK